MKKTIKPIPKIEIEIRKDSKGLTLGLSPRTIRQLSEELGFKPVRSVYISHHVKDDFDFQYGDSIRYLIPALLGINHNSDLKYIKKIEFVIPYPYKVMSKINVDTLIETL